MTVEWANAAEFKRSIGMEVTPADEHDLVKVNKITIPDWARQEKMRNLGMTEEEVDKPQRMVIQEKPKVVRDYETEERINKRMMDPNYVYKYPWLHVRIV